MLESAGKLRWFRRLTAAAVLLAAAPGCTRKFFRERTDKDVTGVLTQKNIFPDWKIENWHVYPDPRARYADLSNPDRPTFPPDDYAAYRLSPNPQQPRKKVGVGRVDGEGYFKYLTVWDSANRTEAASLRAAEERSPLGALPGSSTAAPLVPNVKPEPLPMPIPKGQPPEPTPPPLDLSKLPPPQVELIVSSPEAIEAPKLDSAIQPTAARCEGPMSVTPAAATEPPDRLPEFPTPSETTTETSTQAPPSDPQPLPKAVNPSEPDLAPKDVPPEAAPSPEAAAETPEDYLKALASNVKGFRLKLQQAIELAVFNSRELQDQREALYNAALPVTLQRFSFAAQAFDTETAIRTSLGPQVPGGPLNQWQINSTFGFSRLFPTGATLLAQLANQFVVNLGSGAPYTSVSNLSLTVAQPFLQGGGYAVTLEPLTQAERTLLYGIRAYARYRRLFYVALAAGGGYTNNPYGLVGLSINLGRGIGNNLTAPTAGFLPTILRNAVNGNTQRNINSLTQLLKLYQAFREGGQQSDLQVSQVELQLIGVQSSLLGPGGPVSVGGGATGGGTGSALSGGLRGYLDNLDNFKLQLGLPMTTPLELDDGPLRPIRLQLARFEAVYKDIQEVEGAARRYDLAEPLAAFRDRWRTYLTNSGLTRGTRFAADIRVRWGIWERLTDDQIVRRLAEVQEQRRRILDRKTDLDLKGLPQPEADVARLAMLTADIDLGQFEQALRRYETQPWAKEQGTLRTTVQTAAFRDVFNGFYQLVLEARNDRLARIREQWPVLPPLTVKGCDLLKVPLDDAYTVGIQTALSGRLDLMNTRGQVVDAWRQIKVQANALQGVLNVSYNLNASTPPNSADAASFSANRTTQTLTFNASPPLIRRAQRNAYRAALIDYQAQRRNLMSFEDNIANDVRGDIRELRVIAEQYRLQQRLIELGYSQVDNAQEILIAPPAPPEPGKSNQADAGSAAALTLQVLNAQANLLAAQNNLYVIWVNYVISRMQFYLDLEQLPLDARGLWLDEYSPSSDDRQDRPDAARERTPGWERLPAPQPLGPAPAR